jgi:hypothetical protein
MSLEKIAHAITKNGDQADAIIKAGMAIESGLNNVALSIDRLTKTIRKADANWIDIARERRKTHEDANE